MKKNLKYIIPILILSLFGILSIYMSKNVISNINNYLYHQIIFLIIGIILLFILKNLNFNIIKKYNLLLYIISIFMLIYVLLFGKSINGSKSWINIFGISLQPSEFAKITLLLCLDKYIKTKYGILKSLVLLIIPSLSISV